MNFIFFSRLLGTIEYFEGYRVLEAMKDFIKFNTKNSYIYSSVILTSYVVVFSVFTNKNLYKHTKVD